MRECIAQPHSRHGLIRYRVQCYYAMDTANYKRVTGVELAYWNEENDDATPADVTHAKITEMYAGGGELVIRFEERESGGYYDLTIPIKAKDSWNEFVESLPMWSNV